MREPREAHLPQGENTYLSDDGCLLLAACDGEVVLHDRLAHVRPMHVVDGDDLAHDVPFVCQGDLFVRGTVGTGRRIGVTGDVHIEGHIYEAVRSQSRDGRAHRAGSFPRPRRPRAPGRRRSGAPADV